jgi:hypothetical protein
MSAANAKRQLKDCPAQARSAGASCNALLRFNLFKMALQEKQEKT